MTTIEQLKAEVPKNAAVGLVSVAELQARAGRFDNHPEFVRYVIRRLALETTPDGRLTTFEKTYFPKCKGVVKMWTMRGMIGAARAVELEYKMGLPGLTDLLIVKDF